MPIFLVFEKKNSVKDRVFLKKITVKYVILQTNHSNIKNEDKYGKMVRYSKF